MLQNYQKILKKISWLVLYSLVDHENCNRTVLMTIFRQSFDCLKIVIKTLGLQKYETILTIIKIIISLSIFFNYVESGKL